MYVVVDHRDWEQKIELLPEVSSLAHAFFYTTKDTAFSKAASGHHYKSCLSWCDPFGLFENSIHRQFSWAKNISWKMHRMWWKRLCSDSLSVPNYKKPFSMYMEKIAKKTPQICAQAVGIMYNTYENFFVLAGFMLWKAKQFSPLCREVSWLCWQIPEIVTFLVFFEKHCLHFGFFLKKLKEKLRDL